MANTPQPDLSEFLKLSRPKKKPCAVGTARGSLTDAEQEQFDAAVQAGSAVITVKAIEQWFEARGHEVSHSAIVSHRANKCACRDD